MSNPRPELTKPEWLLMNICWSQGRSTARQVYEKVLPRKHWEYQTVKTMLDRLVVKGYLKIEKLGPLCLFEPAIPRSKALGSAIDGFLETVLDNTVAPLFVHLARKKKLSDQELAQIRELLEKANER